MARGACGPQVYKNCLFMGPGPSFPDLGGDQERLRVGGGQSYSLFIDKDEFQRRLAVVRIETYSSKGELDVSCGGGAPSCGGCCLRTPPPTPTPKARRDSWLVLTLERLGERRRGGCCTLGKKEELAMGWGERGRVAGKLQVTKACLG